MTRSGTERHISLERFETDCCMFASDFIMDKASMGLKQLYRLYVAVVADLPVAERRKLSQKKAQWIRRIDGH